MRTATVGSPAVTAAGTLLFFGSTSVSGPGQKAAASFLTNGCETSASVPACSSECTCTISGSMNGRAFASKIRRTESSRKAFAASP